MRWAVVSATLLVAVVVNAALIFSEEPLPQPQDWAPDLVEDPFENIVWEPARRFQNMEQFGLSAEDAKEVTERSQFYVRQARRLERMIDKQDDLMGEALCYTGDLPPPYALLEFIVEEKAGQRRMLAPVQINEFEPQVWFTDLNVMNLYQQEERTTRRREDATVLTLASVLLGEEQALFDRSGPYGTGPLSGYERLAKKKPQVEILVRDYLAFVHVLAELANKDGGICDR